MPDKTTPDKTRQDQETENLQEITSRLAAIRADIARLHDLERQLEQQALILTGRLQILNEQAPR